MSAPAATGYAVFLRGSAVGREDVTVQAGTAGTTIVTEGRIQSASPFIIRRAEFKYASDWSAESFQLDASMNGVDVTLRAR